MKTLLAKLLAVLVGLGLLSGYLELGLRRMPNGYNQKRDLLDKRLPGMRLLVQGASRENMGIRPGFLDPQGFNLAYVAQDYYYDRLAILRILDKAPRLRLVILPFSVLTLGYRISGGPEYWRVFFYKIFQGLPNEDPSTRHDLRNFSALALFGPSIALLDAFRGFKDTPDVGEDGQQRNYPQSDSGTRTDLDDQAALKRLAFLDSVADDRNLAPNLEILDELLSDLDRRNIRVVFVAAPCYGPFWRNIDGPKWARDRSLALPLFAKHGCRFFDYLKDPRFTLGDFYDVDHLNTAGADKFTSILGRDFVDSILRDGK